MLVFWERERFCSSFFGGGVFRRLINASHSSFCISASHFKLKLDLAREREFHACVLRERGFALHFFGGGGLRRLINASNSSFCISASHFELKLDLARERDRESGSRFLFRISIYGIFEGLD